MLRVPEGRLKLMIRHKTFLLAGHYKLTMNDKPKAGNMTFHAELLKLTQVQLCPAKLSRAISGSLLPKPLFFALGIP